MSGKRPAPFAIDEKTLEPTEKIEEKPAEGDNPDNRTILKLKREEEVAQPAQLPQSEVKEKKPLFSGLFNNTPNTGFFNSNPFAAKIDLSAPNLFTNNGIKTNNIFKPGSLFAGTEGNIFGFGTGSLPPVRAGEDDDEGDSAELEEKQNLPIDKSKSSGNYEYKIEMKTVFNSHAKKYKRNDGDLVENVEVLVQVKQEGSTAAVLAVRLPLTKHPIFTGLIVPNASTLRVLNNKQENVEIVAVFVEEGKKPIKDKLRLQFDDAETGKKFDEAVAAYLQKEPKEGEKK